MFSINKVITGLEVIKTQRDKTLEEDEKQLEYDQDQIRTGMVALRLQAADLFQFIANGLKAGEQYTQRQLEGTEYIPGAPHPDLIPEDRYYRSDIQSRISPTTLDSQLSKAKRDYLEKHPSQSGDGIHRALIVLRAMKDEDKTTISISAAEKLGVSPRLLTQALEAEAEDQG